MTSAGRRIWWAVLAGGSILAVFALSTTTSRGQEPGPLGRLFRLGKSSKPDASSGSDANKSYASTLRSQGMILPEASSSGGGGGSAAPAIDSSAPGQKLVPRPRTSVAATEADPLITVTSILRSDNGQRFGMFLQVFADGVVIDGEGTHRVPRAAIQPLADAIRASDALRQSGHCGGPATDYIEETHVIVYERAFGRLRANAFSYSGNIAGCDHAIKHLRDALDNLQRKLSGAPAQATGAAASPQPAGAPAASPPEGRPSIPLSTVE